MPGRALPRAFCQNKKKGGGEKGKKKKEREQEQAPVVGSPLRVL